MTEHDILYECAPYWICRAKKGFEVYRIETTHSVRCAIIGYEGDKGLQRAKDEIQRRLKQ